MNTILTDDERREIHRKAALAPSPVDALIDETEAAVLAKLREQEPVAWQKATIRGEEWGDAIVGWEPCTESEAKYLMRPTRALYAEPQPAVVQVPQGWKLVPVELLHRVLDSETVGGMSDASDELRAMLAAAPEAPATAVVQVPQKYDDVLVPFLSMMRHELHANSGKGDRPGWLSMDANTALLEVYYHLSKLQKAVRNNDGPGIQEYAADVANMAMMVLDVCGGIAAAPEAPAHDWRTALDRFASKERGIPQAHIAAELVAEFERLMAAHEAQATAVVQVPSIRKLIADDAFAMTFQTMGQYRSALLKALAAPESPARPSACRLTECEGRAMCPTCTVLAAPEAPALPADVREALKEAREALEDARRFIVNGVEFGYIRMPDPDTPDSAHQTEPNIAAALARIDALGGGE